MTLHAPRELRVRAATGARKLHGLVSEVVAVANDVGHASLALADVHGAALVLLGLAGLDHLGEDLRRGRVAVALELDAVELLLELGDALLLVLRLHQRHLLLLVLTDDVRLLAPPLASNFQQMGSNALQGYTKRKQMSNSFSWKRCDGSTYLTRASRPGRLA